MAKPQSITMAVHTGDVSADTDSIGVVHGQSGEWKLTAASYSPTTATADGSDKYTITLKQGSTSISSALDSDAAGWALGTAYAFTLSAAGASLEFGASDVLTMTLDETGDATMAGNVFLTFEQVRA